MNLLWKHLEQYMTYSKYLVKFTSYWWWKLHEASRYSHTHTHTPTTTHDLDEGQAYFLNIMQSIQ